MNLFSKSWLLDLIIKKHIDSFAGSGWLGDWCLKEAYLNLLLKLGVVGSDRSSILFSEFQLPGSLLYRLESQADLTSDAALTLWRWLLSLIAFWMKFSAAFRYSLLGSSVSLLRNTAGSRSVL